MLGTKQGQQVPFPALTLTVQAAGDRGKRNKTQTWLNLYLDSPRARLLLSSAESVTFLLLHLAFYKETLLQQLAGAGQLMGSILESVPRAGSSGVPDPSSRSNSPTGPHTLPHRPHTLHLCIQLSMTVRSFRSLPNTEPLT